MSNDPTRQHARQLTELQQAQIAAAKTDGNALITFLDSCGQGRELDLAKTKVEEAVMWAVKGITA